MLIDIDSIFKYKIPNEKKLSDYGFNKTSEAFIKEFPIMKSQFNLIVTVTKTGEISFKVIENEFGEEYALVNVESAQGSFISSVRSACDTALTDIAKKCFDTEILKAEQTKRILSYIKTAFNAEPEFLWEKTPDCAAFRRQDNTKWFAVIMTIDKSKLGLNEHGNVEIIDIKAPPETVKKLLESKEFYPAYHMNKKHWITICLDGSVSDEMLFAMLSASYECAGVKK